MVNVYVTIWSSCSDSVERDDTLEDNSVQLQTFVQYEPDLFVSRYVQHRNVSPSLGGLCVKDVFVMFFFFPLKRLQFEPIRGSSHSDDVRGDRAGVPHSPQGKAAAFNALSTGCMNFQVENMSHHKSS